jgi:hypothetical protein
MESHPEEFDLVDRQTQLNPDKRWDFVIRPLLERAESMVRGEPSFQLGFLSNEEVSIVFRKLMTVQGDFMLERVMNEVLRDQPNVKFGGDRNIGE